MTRGLRPHLPFSVCSSILGSGHTRLATACAVTLQPVYMLSSARLPFPSFSSWKTLVHPPRPRPMVPLLGSLPSIPDLSLSLQDLMGVGTWPVCSYLSHRDHEGPVSSTLTLSSVGWHIMKVGKGSTSPSPGTC